ncbi:TonB-dependent siderophore receptor, partial [Bradyrhizobium sp. SHOUNA76]|nr:TonB-dependent siderophore receptor [Bradyrhizobium sp. SHOUNA76]
MTTYLRTATRLIGGALPLLAGLIDAAPAEAQSSSQELPAVVVERPSSRPKAGTRPLRSRQAGQTTNRRRQHAQSNANSPAAGGGGAAAETATGPVQGYVASRSGTGTKTDTPLRETPQ